MSTETSQEFDIKVNDQLYHVKTCGDVDLILYKIFDNNTYRFTIGINENAEWELVSNDNGHIPTDEDNILIQQLGDAIEKHEA